MKKILILLVCFLAVTVSSREAPAFVIDFDAQALTGPSLFSTAGPVQHLIINVPTFGNVTFDGGVILTNTANLPADQTSVYGTADFGQDTTGPKVNPIVVTFPSNITNFFLDVYNGETFNVDYRVYDNIGNTATFNLVPNLSSGQTLVGFAATGSIVYIEAISGLPNWDFFIDNIHFNEPLPAVPEPATMLLLGSGLIGLAGFARKRFRK